MLLLLPMLLFVSSFDHNITCAIVNSWTCGIQLHKINAVKRYEEYLQVISREVQSIFVCFVYGILPYMHCIEKFHYIIFYSVDWNCAYNNRPIRSIRVSNIIMTSVLEIQMYFFLCVSIKLTSRIEHTSHTSFNLLLSIHSGHYQSTKCAYIKL